jgi:hypothetical protein
VWPPVAGAERGGAGDGTAEQRDRGHLQAGGPSFTVCMSSSAFPRSCYAACPAGGSQTVPRPIA